MNESEAKHSGATRAQLWFIWILAGLALAVPIGMDWYEKNAPLWACDRAIKKTLKAPSTYRRISVSVGHNIEYEAENSFGVPLRGRGHCFVGSSDNDAVWLEASE